MVEYTRQQLESKDKEELIEIILAMQAMVKILVERVDNLEKEVSRLKKPTTSRNSSLPPSKDLTNQRYPKPRRGGERKTGGQPSHPGHTLEMSAIPDIVRDHLPDSNCPGCNRAFDISDFRMMERRQVIDIPPIKSFITEHRAYGVECSCGYCHKGTFPGTVKAPVQYGDNLTGLVCYLSVRQFVPMARLTELISSGRMHIYRMRPDGSEQTRLTFDDHDNWFPHPSPDNKSAAYIAYMEDQKGGHPFGKDVNFAYWTWRHERRVTSHPSSMVARER